MLHQTIETKKQQSIKKVQPETITKGMFWCPICGLEYYTNDDGGYVDTCSGCERHIDSDNRTLMEKIYDSREMLKKYSTTDLTTRVGKRYIPIYKNESRYYKELMNEFNKLSAIEFNSAHMSVVFDAKIERAAVYQLQAQVGTENMMELFNYRKPLGFSVDRDNHIIFNGNFVKHFDQKLTYADITWLRIDIMEELSNCMIGF